MFSSVWASCGDACDSILFLIDLGSGRVPLSVPVAFDPVGLGTHSTYCWTDEGALEQPPSPYAGTLVAGGLLAAFAGLTLSSVIWADSAEIAFDEFNRAALYVGVFLLAALAARRMHLARWSDGFALGIVGIAGLAFFSRCFPDVLLTYT